MNESWDYKKLLYRLKYKFTISDLNLLFKILVVNITRQDFSYMTN